ncbi:hypothetical protein LINGRAHAP2_LOCUS37332 [Linum grandiflorum]
MCLVGDLNMVRSLEEVSGGGGRSRTEMNLLNDFIADEELIDLPLSGGSFTWTNFQQQPTLSRLDRVLINSAWESKYIDCTVQVLTRVCSDHNPLLIATSQLGAVRRPWRFELMWLEHNNFGSFLQQVWNAELEGSGGFFRIAKRLKVLKEKLKEWNSDIFKCNESEIGRCLGLVAVLDGEEESGEWSEDKRIRRCMIKLELDKLWRRQEISWKQKSREIGLTLGDRNTKFFHKMACHNRRRNTVDRLKVNGFGVERGAWWRSLIKEKFGLERGSEWRSAGLGVPAGWSVWSWILKEGSEFWEFASVDPGGGGWRSVDSIQEIDVAAGDALGA